MNVLSFFKKSFLFASLLVTSEAAFSQLSPLAIGTIHPGDSVVIYYDVTINSNAGSQVSSQGTITGNGINVLTDDPDTNTPDDPTITLLNVFPLPVTLLELKAAPNASGVDVTWNVASESNMLGYEVERSSNGRNFQKIGEAAAKNSLHPVSYTVADRSPNSVNFYRLKMIDRSSGSKYSPVVRVDLSGTAGRVVIYPNPVPNNQVTVQLNNMAKGTYELAFYNQAGQPVYRQALSHTGGSVNKTIALPSHLPKGVYWLQLQHEKVLASQSILLQ